VPETMASADDDSAGRARQAEQASAARHPCSAPQWRGMANTEQAGDYQCNACLDDFDAANIMTCGPCSHHYCGESTCVVCQQVAHGDEDCPPQRPETQQLFSLAEEEGWKRCPKCRGLVSQADGCHRMIWVQWVS
jgi:hypothetical protein